jgi:hypothetical protein
MKNILFSLTLLLSSISCKAQTIDLYGPEDYGEISGAYYKDINGFHNQYVGTWLYINGNTSLKLVFQTRNHMAYNTSRVSYFEDVLVGEYQYIENGVEKINTLNNLNNQITDMYDYNLLSIGCVWFPNTRPQCPECLPNEKRLQMVLAEPSRRTIDGLFNSFVLRAFTENGVQKLKVWFVNESRPGTIFDNNGYLTNITGFTIPFGEYILTKQ